MTDKIEIEIKFPLLNGAEIIEKLNKVAKFKYENRQVDDYYDAPYRSFLDNTPVEEWFRLRNSNGKYSINYKNWHHRTHCDEFESELSSIDDFKCIFQVLGFSSLVTVDKLRKVWDLGDFEISIDDVKDLGCSIEIEYKGNDTDIEGIRKEMYKILETLETEKGEEDNRGYPYNLLIKKGLIKL